MSAQVRGDPVRMDANAGFVERLNAVRDCMYEEVAPVDAT